MSVLNVRCFQLQGALPPYTPDQGLCPWTPLGALPPDPRYRLALPRSPCAPPNWNAGSASPIANSWIRQWFGDLTCRSRFRGEWNGLPPCCFFSTTQNLWNFKNACKVAANLVKLTFFGLWPKPPFFWALPLTVNETPLKRGLARFRIKSQL